MEWVLVIIGISALIVFGALVSAQLRRGGMTPGPPAGEPLDSTHDEPLEDTAAALDRPRHEREAHDASDAARDGGRLLGH